MTVRELIELNNMICDVIIEVRENGTLLLDKLSIGVAVGRKPPYPTRVPKKPEYANNLSQHTNMYKDAQYILQSINAWDDGKDVWQVKVNRIPKQYLDLQVYDWEVHPCYCPIGTRRSNYNSMFEGNKIEIIALQEGWKPAEEKPKAENKDTEVQLDGQITLEEWLEDE